MRPAWAVAVAAASLAADRSGKDNAVASRTIPARARRPLPGHAAGRGDATAHRRLRRRRAGPRSAAGAARQRQGLRVRRQPGVAADPGVVGLVNLHVQAAGLDADVFVADSEVRYLAPLFADLRAQARIAEGESWERFVATLRERGRARTTLVATVPLPDGGIATTCRARYEIGRAHV